MRRNTGRAVVRGLIDTSPIQKLLDEDYDNYEMTDPVTACSNELDDNDEDEKMNDDVYTAVKNSVYL